MTHRSEREALIEAFKSRANEWDSYDFDESWDYSTEAGILADIALAVFEKAHTPTTEQASEYRAIACEPDTGEVYNSTSRPAPSEKWARSDAALEQVLQSDPDLPELVLKVERRLKAGPWVVVEDV